MRAPHDTRPVEDRECRALAPAEGSIDLPAAPKGSVDPAVARKVPIDLAVARIADTQQGLVTYEQLLDCGLSRNAIARRRARGWLRVMHRGVYAVGHTALPELALKTAAVLACGDQAILSHHSAASVWSLRPPRAAGDIDVTVVGRNCGLKKGIRVHRGSRFCASPGASS